MQRGWSPHLRRYQRRLPLAAGVGLIVGAGMAAFAPLFEDEENGDPGNRPEDERRLVLAPRIGQLV